MDPEALFNRYEELQRYVGWTEEDGERLQRAGSILEPRLGPLIDDFYEEALRLPDTRNVITARQEQIKRLKGTLRQWIHELLIGPHDQGYVERRWKVGTRHAEIGLDQVYVAVAMSRLRRGLERVLECNWHGTREAGDAVRCSLQMALDVDLAMIGHAYQAEYTAWQQRAERLAAIGEVAGGIAEELRGPLNVIRTSLYYISTARNASAQKKASICNGWSGMCSPRIV